MSILIFFSLKTVGALSRVICVTLILKWYKYIKKNLIVYSRVDQSFCRTAKSMSKVKMEKCFYSFADVCLEAALLNLFEVGHQSRAVYKQVSAWKPVSYFKLVLQ